MITFDEVRTGKRFGELDAYYRNNVLTGTGGEFICQAYQHCRSSVENKGKRLFEGQLSHLGKKYDMRIDGRDLRIVITGKEWGQAYETGVGPEYATGEPMTRKDLEWRQRTIMRLGMKEPFDKKCDWTRRHPGGSPRYFRNRMARGVTLVLKRLILGEEFVSAEGERFASWSEEFIGGNVGSQSDHIFNMFAWVNSLLCSAITQEDAEKQQAGTKRGSAYGHRTEEMWQHCSAHYMETLKILEPSIVVFLGRRNFRDILKHQGRLKSCWTEDEEKGLGFFEPKFGDKSLKFVTCSFYQPSYRPWDNASGDYWGKTVLPTLSEALARALLGKLGVDNPVSSPFMKVATKTSHEHKAGAPEVGEKDRKGYLHIRKEGKVSLIMSPTGLCGIWENCWSKDEKCKVPCRKTREDAEKLFAEITGCA